MILAGGLWVLEIGNIKHIISHNQKHQPTIGNIGNVGSNIIGYVLYWMPQNSIKYSRHVLESVNS